MQRRNTTGNVPQTAAATVSLIEPEETEICNSELEEGTCHDQNMEGDSSKEEQPTGLKRREKPKINSC